MAAASFPCQFPGRHRRADLHCHSVASTEADEAVLDAIGCPECYSEPREVYAQAKRRGMDFVTITDHDSINGVLQLAGPGGGLPADVLVGEELTCYFPEDHCKMHLLVWGISKADHDALQERAADLYAVAAYIEQHRIAHAVAHPLYRQNDKLERWHLERLILLFKGFEALNGAHSVIHRESLEPVLDGLTQRKISELSEKHKIVPRWPEPWVKSRTAGSDDHGLLNVGRTWTEFPAEAKTVADLLDCLREGRCRPGGEAGSSLKLAHNFFSVAIRYHARKVARPGVKPSLTTSLLQTLVGDRPVPRKRDLVGLVVANRVRAAGQAVRRGIMRPFSRRLGGSRRPIGKQGQSGTALLGDLLMESFKSHAGSCAPLMASAKGGEAPLAQHEAIFSLVNALNRDIIGGIVSSVQDGVADGEVASIFNALSTVAAHQFALLPYYFALFHQNQERHLLPRITGQGRPLDARALRVGVFTDLLHGDKDGSRFLRDLTVHAASHGRTLVVHTCGEEPPEGARGNVPPDDGIRNFKPLVERPLPARFGGRLVIPPVAEVLEWVDRQQFDVIHIDTPGPMGLCGWVAARMLRVPLTTSHHFDPASRVHQLTKDYRLTAAVAGYVRWLYGQTACVFARGRDGRDSAFAAGAPQGRVALLPPASSGHSDARLGAGLGDEDGIEAFWDRLASVARVARESHAEAPPAGGNRPDFPDSHPVLVTPADALEGAGR